MASPLERTIKLFAENGWITYKSKTERWVKFGKANEKPGERKGFGKSPGHRVDLWGIADAMFLQEDPFRMAAVNACAYSGISAHVRTILGQLPLTTDFCVPIKKLAKMELDARETLRCARVMYRVGVIILVVGWRKLKKPVGRKLWVPRIVQVLPLEAPGFRVIEFDGKFLHPARRTSEGTLRS